MTTVLVLMYILVSSISFSFFSATLPVTGEISGAVAFTDSTVPYSSAVLCDCFDRFFNFF